MIRNCCDGDKYRDDEVCCNWKDGTREMLVIITIAHREVESF